jgi:hypothetical protein
MTRDVMFCRPKGLAARCLGTHEGAEPKNIPVVDQESRPLRLLQARDILQVLLKKSEDEESMLRDYVMGVGY